jgi:hypothetical protein
MDGSSRLEKKKGSHGCCGRKGALAIGAGIAAAMAIVASAFNTDHPNMLEPTTVRAFPPVLSMCDIEH